jgi:predicted signal transduction protein with EAL and GGDEF domain
LLPIRAEARARVSWLSFSGWVILIIALAVAAHWLGAEPVWIGIGALALVGIIASSRRASSRY